MAVRASGESSVPLLPPRWWHLVCVAMLRRRREFLLTTVSEERLLATWSSSSRGTLQLACRRCRLVCPAASVPFSRPAVATLLELLSHELE